MYFAKRLFSYFHVVHVSLLESHTHKRDPIVVFQIHQENGVINYLHLYRALAWSRIKYKLLFDTHMISKWLVRGRRKPRPNLGRLCLAVDSPTKMRRPQVWVFPAPGHFRTDLGARGPFASGHWRCPYTLNIATTTWSFGSIVRSIYTHANVQRIPTEW
jgi:hypothetical protein